MGPRYKILIVDDDPCMSFYTQQTMERSGYDTIVAENGHDAETCAISHCPDVILLDLGLPDMNGTSVLHSIRQWTNVPVIVISAENDENIKKDALDKGADDYLVKPFGLIELLARIRVALRHARCSGTNMKLSSCEYSVLTQAEFKLVALLGRYAGQVVSYEFLMKHLWGPNSKGSNQILRVNMANIRKKIERDPSKPRYFITENGVGYRLADS